MRVYIISGSWFMQLDIITLRGFNRSAIIFHIFTYLLDLESGHLDTNKSRTDRGPEYILCP